MGKGRGIGLSKGAGYLRWPGSGLAALKRRTALFRENGIELLNGRSFACVSNCRSILNKYGATPHSVITNQKFNEPSLCVFPKED